MSLRIHRDQPIMRISGTLTGIGFVLVGAFSVLGGADLATDPATDLAIEMGRERALGFGITAIIIGVIAVLCSLLVKDLSDIWCRHPHRWK